MSDQSAITNVMIAGRGRFRFASRITGAVTAALAGACAGVVYGTPARGIALAAPQRAMRSARDLRVLHGAIVGVCAAVVLVAAWRAAAQEKADARRIDVVARRFSFEPAAIEVRSGERVELHVRSADGVHGLEIRQLKIKQRIPRGSSVTRIDFVAPAPGEYPILCSEYCGADHEDMKGLLVVRATGETSPAPEPR